MCAARDAVGRSGSAAAFAFTCDRTPVLWSGFPYAGVTSGDPQRSHEHESGRAFVAGSSESRFRRDDATGGQPVTAVRMTSGAEPRSYSRWIVVPTLTAPTGNGPFSVNGRTR